MRKRGFVLLISFFSFIFCANFAYGYVGVSPAAYSIDFQPNLKQVFNFDFYSDDPNVEFDVVATGDLVEYVEISRNELSGSGSVSALLKLPKEIEKPGKHRIYIEGAQRRKDTSATLGIVANVRGVIDVRVPYPGKYAEVEFFASNANAGEPVDFKLKIYSRGDEDIVTTSYIEIFDFKNKSVGTLPLGIYEVPSTQSVDIDKQLDTRNYPAGRYTARAIVQYYDKEARAEAPFRLGELYVDVVDYTREFDREKINPISIDVESFWNDPVENLYAEFFILGYENLIPSFSTPSVNLQGFERKTLTAYFDTYPIQEDKFKARVVLYYYDKSTEKIIELRFKKEVNYVLIVVIAGAVLLIAIIIALVLWIRKLKKVGRKK